MKKNHLVVLAIVVGVFSFGVVIQAAYTSQNSFLAAITSSIKSLNTKQKTTTTLINTDKSKIPTTRGDVFLNETVTADTKKTTQEEMSTLPRILYVRANAPAGGDGLSWETAFNTLQEAAANVSTSTRPWESHTTDEIWVARGTYTPTTGTDRSASFTFRPGTKIFGGFNGTEHGIGERTIGGAPTILSGEIGSPTTPEDNSYNVIEINYPNVTYPVEFNLLTISDGYGVNAPSNSNTSMGAGINLSDGALTLTDVVVENNSSKVGGGIWVYNNVSPPLPVNITRSVFTNNYASLGGGAISFAGGTVRDSSFFGNYSLLTGGAIVSSHDSTRIINSMFVGNSALKGGGFYGQGTISRSTFMHNSAFSEGGAIWAFASKTKTVNSRLLRNSSGYYGGGIFSSGSTDVVNSVFANNYAGDSGGGFYSVQSNNNNGSFINNTFYGNKAIKFGGGYFSYQGSPTISNSIFWENIDSTGKSESAQIYKKNSTPAINNNVVQGWTGALGGANNNGNNPLLARPAGQDNILGTTDDDLRIAANSSAVNLADASALPADTADVDGDNDVTESVPFDIASMPRQFGGGLDSGAFEHNFSTPTPGSSGCQGDINNDNVINGLDLSVVLGNFGMVCTQ